VRLQAEFAAGDAATRRRLLQPAHAKERFENYDPEAPSLSGCDRPDRVRMLLAHDPGLANARDDDGATPLHRLHGALANGAEIIDLLVQHHADVNARDRRGVTVLAKVLAAGAADLADLLRSLGAN
jgi:ankyrin repeat protein